MKEEITDTQNKLIKITDTMLNERSQVQREHTKLFYLYVI